MPSAAPPLHSVVLVAICMVTFLAILPSADQLDHQATIQVFTNRVFPNAMSLAALAYIRLLFALFIFGVTLHTTLVGKGWLQVTQFLPISKLTKTTLRISGIKTQFPFTSWSWNLLGISFALNARIAFLAASHQSIHPWTLRIALLVYETAAPCTLLVAAVVRYAIWPNILRNGGSTAELKHPRTLLWHNANVFMALSEAALMGGIPVHFAHIGMAPLFGLAYVLFTWSMIHQWAEPKYGPQFIYFFFDTTLGRTTSIALLVLLAILMIFYSLFSVVELVLAAVGGGLVVHMMFMAGISALVCKFTD
jgi:hypothetical protein